MNKPNKNRFKISQTANELTQMLNCKQQEELSYSKLKILIPYLKKHPKLICGTIVTSIISGIILLPIPLIIRYIIDKFIVYDETNKIILFCLFITALYILNFVVRVILNYVFTLLNNDLLLSIKKDLVDKIINLPFSFFNKNQSGYLIARINEINQLEFFLSTTLISLIVTSLTFMCSIFILGFLSWQLLVLTIVFIPIQYWVVSIFTGAMQKSSKAMMEKSATLNRNMQEVVSGIQTIKSFATEEKEKRKIHSSMYSVFKTSLNQNLFMGISQEVISFVSNFSSILVLFVSSFLIIKNDFTVGLYIASLQFVNYILRPVQFFASANIVIQPIVVAVNRISEYFEILGENDNIKRNIDPASFNGKIKFSKISFSYNGGEPILNSLSFCILPGEKIIIRGDNGSGKTTIIKLLLQLHLQQNGIIQIDDEDVRNINLTTLRKKIGLVSQDIFLFNDTIKNNILYGTEEATTEEINLIIDEFCPFIKVLPDGINTIVGENGNNLSGGQKQAISIIRTILKRPDILVFDEGNSNLDQDSRKILINLVKRYFDNKTCIFVTHDEFVYPERVRVLTLKNKSIIE